MVAVVVMVVVVAAVVAMLMPVVVVTVVVVLVIVLMAAVVMVMMVLMVMVMTAAADGADLLLGHKIGGQGVSLLHGRESCAPVSWSQGVVTMGALGFFPRRRATASSTLAGLAFWVRLRTMAPAYCTWFS